MRTIALGALAGLVGLMVFLVSFGADLVIPSHTDWCFYNLDCTQHYLGWEIFRRSPWDFPLGYMDFINWPIGTSIVFTDSIPLVAFVTKALMPAEYTGPFQYLGGWLAASWTLQAVCGFVLLRLLGMTRLNALLGALFFVLLPTLFIRAGHEALTAHWLLILALLLHARAPHRAAGHAAWTALGIVAAAVHFYILFMVLAVWAAWLAAAVAGAVMDRRLARTSATVAAGGGTLLLILFAMWSIGYFVIPLGDASGGGFGLYSMNLNAPFNPMFDKWSAVFPVRPYESGQYEGFHYLGLGVIGLVLVAAVLGLSAGFRRLRGRGGRIEAGALVSARGTWLVLAALALTVLAVSGRVTWDDRVLFEYHLPLDFLTGAVRASGRLFWLVTLALVAWSIVTVCRRLKPAAASVLLGVLLAVQVYDIRGGLADAGFLKVAEYVDLEPGWEPAIAAADRLAFVPSMSVDPYFALPLTPPAIRHETPMTAWYLPRQDTEKAARRDAATLAALRDGTADPRALYIMDGAAACQLAPAYQERASRLNGHIVVPPAGLDPPLPSLPPFPFRPEPPAAADPAALVEACGPGCTMVISARDEARLNLPEPFIAAMEARGSAIRALEYRASYAAILEDGALIAEAMSSKAPVTLHGSVSGAPIRVTSAGGLIGNVSSIRIAGRECSLSGRGLNVTVLDRRRGAVSLHTFDTHAGW